MDSIQMPNALKETSFGVRDMNPFKTAAMNDTPAVPN